MPPRAKKQEKTVSSGSAVPNKDFLTASEKSGAADLPNGAKPRKKASGERFSAASKDVSVEAKSQKKRENVGFDEQILAKTRKNAGKTASAKAGKRVYDKEEKTSERSAKRRKKPEESNGQTAEKTDENTVSCKTPQVMRLISDDSLSNPVIVAGKSRIPTRLRGREPLTRVLKRQLQGEPLEQGEAEVVNLTEIAAKYEAPLVLDRFNACSCEKCVKVFSEMALMKVAVRYARITQRSPEARARELEGRVEPMRRTVRIAMIRELIGCKKRVFHDE